jgi:Bacterial toxin 28
MSFERDVKPGHDEAPAGDAPPADPVSPPLPPAGLPADRDERRPTQPLTAAAVADLPLLTMWADEPATVERTSAPQRPHGAGLPDPPGDMNYTFEGRQEAWARLLGKESFTLADVERYLGGRQLEQARKGAKDRERDDETVCLWPDGGVRSRADQRKLELRLYVNRALGVLTGNFLGSAGYGLARALGKDEESALAIGETTGALGDLLPLGKKDHGPRPRGMPSRPHPSRSQQRFKRQPPAHRRPAKVPEKQLSQKGREVPVPLTREEEARAQKWAGQRNPYLKQARELDPTGVSPRVWRMIDPSKDSAVARHMTPDDAAAQMKEGRGVVIPKPNGQPYRHDREYQAARQSVLNRIRDIQRMLGDPREPLTEYERTLLQKKVGDLSVLLDEYERTITGGK